MENYLLNFKQINISLRVFISMNTVRPLGSLKEPSKEIYDWSGQNTGA